MAVAAILAGVGGATKAFGDVYEAQAAGAAADYNAQVAEQNAQLVRQQANEEARRAGVVAIKQIGQARANVGASGVQMDGSALDVLRQSAANAELDVLTIQHQGQVKEYGYQAEAALDRQRASNSRTLGYFKAAGDLLSAGGQSYSFGKK